ncbi:N-acetylmuramoyl-L-alanine amidase [Candidatus Halobeggiatoa sp. HSG11]|nr:N-acetylmuramoyl-L-alanine amidase [Candidatus Halobeggiatoa sp. HSG11]
MRLFLILILISISNLATAVNINGVNFWKSNRIVFDMTAPVSYNIFSLSAPHRIVIDLKNTRLTKKNLKVPTDHHFIKNIRSAFRNARDLRVVLDLKKPIRTKSFLLKPDKSHGNRLVIEINPRSASKAFKNTFKKPKAKAKPIKTVKKGVKSSLFQHQVGKRDLVIAIDAGHGGIDSGAVGVGGTYEKHITLAIAKQLATLVSAKRGMRPVMIRNGDYFIKLQKRIDLAREYSADLLVSIHADAYPSDNNVGGSSVYMLSHSGASSEAATWMAERENSADLIGGISLSDKDDLLAQVLFDLSQTKTLEASALVAQKVLGSLKSLGNNHSNHVQKAGFLVLRSPDIPSILIETGFISNDAEEQRLNNPRYRHHLAEAIFRGIRGYFTNYNLGTLLVRK